MCKRQREFFWLVAASTLVGGVGCITSGPGDYGVSAEVRELHLELCPDGLIDDAEDNNGQINTVGGRDGYWFTFKDEVGSTVDPDGSSFHMSEGAFGFNGLNALPGAGGATYFDASNWAGLSMWVRKGTGPSASSIFAAVNDRYTDPSGAALFSAAEADELLKSNGAYCDFNAVDVVGNDGVPDPLLSQCDRFGAGVGIATEWRFFKVPFTRMRQRAFGRPSLQSTPDPRILGLDFGLDGENWDFWIDDLAFYREPE